MIVHKALRAEAGLEFGTTLQVKVEKDNAPREVVVPADMAALLQSADLTEVFANLSFTNRKEYAHWVESAKLPQTRQGRLLKTIELLKKGVKNPSSK
jgi:uncharacterized protein YdeI (YjbR/CyaY-like superfamily)